MTTVICPLDELKAALTNSTEALRADLEAEVARLGAILSGDESGLLEQWLAKDGPEAHAVHLASVEHETELGKMTERIEAWQAAEEAWRVLDVIPGEEWEAQAKLKDSLVAKARALDNASRSETKEQS